MKKNLIHFFAVIGFGTFILLACSVDEIADSMENNNNNNNSEIVSNNYGKYQIGSTGSPYHFNVLNTETGEVKTYKTSAMQPNTSTDLAAFLSGTANFSLLYTTQTN